MLVNMIKGGEIENVESQIIFKNSLQHLYILV